MAKTPLDLAELTASDVTVVVDVAGGRLPRILYWGPRLPPMDLPSLASFRRAAGTIPALGGAGREMAVPVVAEAAAGWTEEPGLLGSRQGRDFAPSFRTTEVARQGDELRVRASDTAAGLRLELRLRLEESGLLGLRARIENVRGVYDLHALTLTVPTPDTETEVLDQTGHWQREHRLQRHHLTIGVHGQETWVSRGLRSTLVEGTCEPGAGWRRGSVHLAHLAWSGNVRLQVERSASGQQYIRAGELLAPGEVRLSAGESYASPWLYGSTGGGLDRAAARFHAHVRSLTSHPQTPRPVTLNSWEAVYFDQSEDKLDLLAQRAAAVGVERFVLDDGWFSSRRDDTSGLGDWYVSRDVWPHGLGHFAERVHRLGMQFGIWVEPEMVNPDSELARAHPGWILGPADRDPVESRHQQVLDLANPEAWRNIFGQLHALLDSCAIDYLKWDFNRDLLESADRRNGRAAYHDQVVAVYSMIDAIHREHPAVEIESCASGGGRMDLGIVERVQRVWASDCLDPLERAATHDGTDLLLPPEIVGSHIGAPVSHATGRESTLQFRAISALPYHLGIEWDLTALTEAETEALASWVRCYKSHRDLFHRGNLVHSERGNLRLRGVVDLDGSQAVYGIFCTATGESEGAPRIDLPGLTPSLAYDVAPLPPGDTVGGRIARTWPDWWREGGLRLPGAVLGEYGIAMPGLNPEQAVMIRCVAR